MQPEAFAAERRERLVVADEALRPIVEAALDRYVAGQKGTWANELVDAAVQVWVENFQAEAPGARRDAAELRFRQRLALGLRKTTDYGDVTDGQVDRITRWLSTYATNAGTVQGSNAAGRSGKRWVTMHDDAVRESHEPLDGQVRPVGGTFDVAGTKLAYPGEPVGPPEVWINCRCVAMPAAREGETMSDATFVLGPDEPLEDDNPDVVLSNNAFAAVTDPGDIAVEVADEEDLVDDEPEDDEELITEIPVHGVAAPEGVATGDGRMFAIGGLTNRDLPLPLLYQPVSVPGHDQAYTVGRLDEIWRDEEANLVRYRGALILGREYANEVVGGIIDGTIRGVSVDVDDIELDLTGIVDDEGNFLEQEYDPTTAGKMPLQTYKSARISGLTIVSIPAFQEAYIALGLDDEEGLTASAALTACGCLQAGAAASAEGDEFRDYTAEQRKEMAEKGQAMPDGSYPIADEEDLRNAIQAIGRASDPSAVRAHIKKRARALGKTDLIPDGWAAQIIDLTALSEDELAEYNALDEYDQDVYAEERAAVLAAASFAPGTKDGPGWITHPVPTARIRRYWVRGKGAAKIRWGVPGDFDRCRRQLAKYVQNPDWLAGLCANMHKEATGTWPGQKRGDKHALVASGAVRAPAIILAGGAKVYAAELFDEPPVDLAMPVNIDRKSRRIYGYLAEWGVCHVGIEGICTAPVPSENDYAYFRKGVVETTEGTMRVGNLSYGEGHADIRWRNAVATAHYDKPGAVRAYVNIGENSRGIWYSGVLVPWATDADIDAILAIGAFSGDWRDWGNRELDLIAATCVNTPGYQIKPDAYASGGRQISLTGAGVPARRRALVAAATDLSDPETVAAIARTAVAEYRHQEKVAAKIGPARERVRKVRLAQHRARVGE